VSKCERSYCNYGDRSCQGRLSNGSTCTPAIGTNCTQNTDIQAHGDSLLMVILFCVCTAWKGVVLVTFRRNVTPPSSGSDVYNENGSSSPLRLTGGREDSALFWPLGSVGPKRYPLWDRVALCTMGTGSLSRR
jgi:hypothetical protein